MSQKYDEVNTRGLHTLIKFFQVENNNGIK